MNKQKKKTNFTPLKKSSWCHFIFSIIKNYFFQITPRGTCSLRIKTLFVKSLNQLKVNLGITALTNIEVVKNICLYLRPSKRTFLLLIFETGGR